MDEAQFAEMAAWVIQAGLAGQDEAAMVTAFCERLVALGAQQNRLVSVGRYALRGVGLPQELYTLDGAR